MGGGAAVARDEEGVSLEMIPVVICILGRGSGTAGAGTSCAPVGGGGGGRLPEK